MRFEPGVFFGRLALRSTEACQTPRSAAIRGAPQTAGRSGDGDVMAEAMVSRSWPDGETLTVSIEVDESFPDSIAECEAAARRLYAAGDHAHPRRG